MPTIDFDCKDAQHEEASKYPSHPCWGWFKTHTHEFTDPVTVTQITGEIKTGPSESSKFFPVEIQLSEDKTNWILVGETGAKGTERYVPFSVDVPNVLAKYLRFYAKEGYVDGSRGTVYYEEERIPEGRIIDRIITKIQGFLDKWIGTERTRFFR